MEHRINNFTLEHQFKDIIKVTRPNGKELYTNSFKIVREELNKESKQIKLF